MDWGASKGTRATSTTLAVCSAPRATRRPPRDCSDSLNGRVTSCGAARRLLNCESETSKSAGISHSNASAADSCFIRHAKGGRLRSKDRRYVPKSIASIASSTRTAASEAT